MCAKCLEKPHLINCLLPNSRGMEPGIFSALIGNYLSRIGNLFRINGKSKKRETSALSTLTWRADHNRKARRNCVALIGITRNRGACFGTGIVVPLPCSGGKRCWTPLVVETRVDRLHAAGGSVVGRDHEAVPLSSKSATTSVAAGECCADPHRHMVRAAAGRLQAHIERNSDAWLGAEFRADPSGQADAASARAVLGDFFQSASPMGSASRKPISIASRSPAWSWRRPAPATRCSARTRSASGCCAA